MSKSNNNHNGKRNDEPYLFDPLHYTQAFLTAFGKAQDAIQSSIETTDTAKLEEISQSFDPLGAMPIYQNFMQSFIDKPDHLVELNSQYWTQWLDLYKNSTDRFVGANSNNINNNLNDKRFSTESWSNSAYFDFIKQSYLMTCQWVEKLIHSAEELSQDDKDKLLFTAKLYMDAFAPSNFPHTNPDVMLETLRTNGQNLIKGFENLLEDIKRGGGDLAISTTDYSAFEVGKNIATTKGSVVFENDLMQLIQYTPTTDKVFKKPLLIVPPWINKYYILDLREANSLVKWAIDQGHTVFMISWVNPTKDHAHIGFDDYIRDGALAALDAIKSATGEASVNAVGYCLGGTMLSMTLSHLHATGQESRIASATLLTTLLDFEHAGDLKLFLSSEQIARIEEQIEQRGVFEAKHLQQTFRLLRSNDMIWSFVVNNYLMGKDPFAFDLLYWNDDSTNMPAAMQKYYLRNMYLNNKLKEAGALVACGQAINLGDIKTPTYFLSAKDDHIAPWKATYAGTGLFQGDVSFTLSASGHIAGVVNPPAKGKYCYWSNSETPANSEEWFTNATEHSGSWWPHWHEWLTKHSGAKVKARTVNNEIEPAPGRYVAAKAV